MKKFGKKSVMIGIGLCLCVLYWILFPPTDLAYPIVYVDAGGDKVEMVPGEVKWLNTEGETILYDVNLWDAIVGHEGVPVVEVVAGDKMRLNLAYRDVEGTFYNGEIEVKAHTEKVLFSEHELAEWQFNELTLGKRYEFEAPDEPGVYGLEVVFEAEEEKAQYLVNLLVK